MPHPRRAILGLVFALLAGCQSKYSNLPTYQPSTQPVLATGLMDPQPLEAVDAVVAPPVGWKAEPFKGSERHAHQVWLSPTDKTAYGVIHFGLPLRLSAGWVLPGFLDEMQKSEGEATVIGQPTRDDRLPGVRFTVEGGDYKMRINLICKGFRGWAVYAGTRRNQEEVPAELELAEQAKENTKVGEAKATSGQASPTFIRPTASVSE